MRDGIQGRDGVQRGRSLVKKIEKEMPAKRITSQEKITSWKQSLEKEVRREQLKVYMVQTGAGKMMPQMCLCNNMEVVGGLCQSSLNREDRRQIVMGQVRAGE